jgi:phosphonate transport system substrate-binding protein
MAAVLPEQVAYMSRFCAAELRDQAIQQDKECVQFVRQQAAVGFCLDNKFADVGRVASYSELARNWKKEGKRIAQPYFLLIANKKIRPEQLKAIQTARWHCRTPRLARSCSNGLSLSGLIRPPNCGCVNC